MKRKSGKNRHIIDFLSVGEGHEKGPAHKFAQALSRRQKQGQVMAIDVIAPDYEVPKNMAFIRQDALRFIESMQSNSVRIVRDDFFIQLSLLGKGKETLSKQARALGTISKISGAILSNPGNPALAKFSRAELRFSANIQRNELRYIRHVKRVLLPGGRFVLTTDAINAEVLRKLLSQEGFHLRTYKEMNEDEIMRSGSPHTIHAVMNGEKIYRIIAIKPSLQKA